jgi:hypothetical protein
MAVETKPEGGVSPPGETVTSTTNTAGKKKETPSSWIKKHKVAAGGLGIGGLVLLLSAKGKKSTAAGPSAQSAEELATERAALAQQAGALSAAGTPTASGASGGGEGAGAVTPANPAGADTATTTSAAPAAGGEAGADPQLAAAIEGLGGEVSALAAAEHASASAKAQKPNKKKKPASNKAKHNKAEHKKTTQHGGVTVHGRHFPGATGHHKGATHRDAHGTHQTITVHYPGKTHTSTSHNKGQSWTDHTPGHTPPRRSAPTHTHRIPAGSGPPHPTQHQIAKTARKRKR